MTRYLAYTKLFLLLLLLYPVSLTAQDQHFPHVDGDKKRYAVEIEFPQASITGIGMLVKQGDNVVGAVFNEFGVSVVNFSYLPAKKKIKLLSVMDKMDRWYIRRILKRDLLRLMEVLEASGSSYFNSKYNIKYTFTPLIYDDAIEE